MTKQIIETSFAERTILEIEGDSLNKIFITQKKFEDGGVYYEVLGEFSLAAKIFSNLDNAKEAARKYLLNQ